MIKKTLPNMFGRLNTLVYQWEGREGVTCRKVMYVFKSVKNLHRTPYANTSARIHYAHTHLSITHWACFNPKYRALGVT